MFKKINIKLLLITTALGIPLFVRLYFVITAKSMFLINIVLVILFIITTIYFVAKKKILKRFLMGFFIPLVAFYWFDTTVYSIQIASVVKQTGFKHVYSYDLTEKGYNRYFTTKASEVKDDELIYAYTVRTFEGVVETDIFNLKEKTTANYKGVKN